MFGCPQHYSVVFPKSADLRSSTLLEAQGGRWDTSWKSLVVCYICYSECERSSFASKGTRVIRGKYYPISALHVEQDLKRETWGQKENIEMKMDVTFLKSDAGGRSGRKPGNSRSSSALRCSFIDVALADSSNGMVGVLEYNWSRNWIWESHLLEKWIGKYLGGKKIR